jgi:acyl dehydratase
MPQAEGRTRLRSRLDEFVGEPVGSSGRSLAPDPVNQAMIRHWVAAFEDDNPVYIDAERAAASRFGGIVAPPLMLQTWTMATPKVAGIAERGGSPVESERGGALTVLDEAGFSGTLASNSEFEIERYLHLGEIVSSNTVMESISDEKKTRLGAGYFLTWVTTYFEERGEVVGRQRFRVFKFMPEVAKAAGGDSADGDRHDGRDGGAGVGAPRREPRRGSVEAGNKTDAGHTGPCDWDQVRVGDHLRGLEVDVTATVIVAGAIATRDFMPVHHDRDYANAQGAPDIFMNILSSNAYCSRFLTDWAGPDSMLHRVSVRLGVPLFPGSTLTFSGTVTGTLRVSNEGTLEVGFQAATELGNHLTGTATLGLPLEGDR